MKDSRIHTRRFVALALVALAATSTFAQGPGGFGGQGGPPPGMRGGPGGGMRGGRPALDRLPSLAMLATRPEVADELGLSEDQLGRIDAILQEARPPRGERSQGGRPGGDRAAMEAEIDAKVKAVLSAQQVQRLTEIAVQSMGLSAAMVPAVQTRLGLSDAQKASLKALVPARGEGGPGGPGGPPPGGGGGRGPGGPGRGGPRDGRRGELEAKIAAILTADQKATLAALGGKKIDLRQGGPGGPPPGGDMGGPPF